MARQFKKHNIQHRARVIRAAIISTFVMIFITTAVIIVLGLAGNASRETVGDGNAYVTATGETLVVNIPDMSEIKSVHMIIRGSSEYFVVTYLAWAGLNNYKTIIYDCEGLCPDIIRWE